MKVKTMNMTFMAELYHDMKLVNKSRYLKINEHHQTFNHVKSFLGKLWSPLLIVKAFE